MALRGRRGVLRYPGILRGGRGVPLQAPRPCVPLALPEPGSLPGLRRGPPQGRCARRHRGRPQHCRGGAPPHRRPGRLDRGAPAHPVGGGGRAGGAGSALGQGLVPPSGGPRLPHDRAPDAHPVRRRGPAHRPRHPARGPARRHALRARRAVDRTPRARRDSAGRPVPGAGPRRQHGRRRRARPDVHRSGRSLRGARSRLGRARRRGGLRRSARGVPPRHADAHRALPVGPREHSPAGRAARGRRPLAHRRRRARAQSPGRHGAHPARDAHLRHGRLGLRQVHPGARHALPGGRPRLPDRVRGRRAPTTPSSGSSTCGASG